MTSRRLAPAPGTTRDVFSRDHAPVLTVEPGDTVTVGSLDASGYLARPTFPGEDQPKLIPGGRGHCLTGPIEVRGAQPCDPFLGVMGVAPAEPGEHSTIPPRASAGGNIDCRELVAGTTLFLPVAVPGALLYLGDGHAAQGDGEVGGTAIECPMTTSVIIGLATGRPLGSIHAEAPSGRVTFGFDADLNVAMGDALDAMVSWLETLTGLGKAAALALASTCVDLRITQVANRTWGVHALLPTGALGLPG